MRTERKGISYPSPPSTVAWTPRGRAAIERRSDHRVRKGSGQRAPSRNRSAAARSPSRRTRSPAKGPAAVLRALSSSCHGRLCRCVLTRLRLREPRGGRREMTEAGGESPARAPAWPSTCRRRLPPRLLPFLWVAAVRKQEKEKKGHPFSYRQNL
jgi:hypothetical protein